jgi:UDP-2-acetamido-3-amino-2,3-dideoxy-glucuronate N-acetyltransferase
VIGAYAFIGAGAVVTGDVRPFALMVGVPARQRGWMSAHGERVPLPLQGEGEWICPHSQDLYQLTGEQLIRIPSGSAC